ncbi:hypothetical protein GCM10009593_29460 [Microlunatus antarcticus]
MQVTVAPGAREAAPAGQVGVGAVPVPVKPDSVTATPVTVAVPELVTA